MLIPTLHSRVGIMISKIILILSILPISCNQDKTKPFKKQLISDSCESENIEFFEQRIFSRLNAQAKIDCLNDDFMYVKYIENTFECEHYVRPHGRCFDDSKETRADCFGFFRCFSLKDE